SYYDGSPMIAYFIRIATLLFGDTLFALNLVTIVSTALTSFIIYKTARLCLNKEASYVTVLIWLFSPLVTLDLINQTTYDTPLTLFWALTLYFTIRYIQFNRNQDLYYIGLSIGLMLLSKYSGIVLVLALLIFLVATPYRRLFKSRHFYLALTLAIIVFSPVI
ncbi:glycosyltransferase family 39 protein, partial [Legionella taurinensis]